jgi:hypothetical protein
MTRSRSSVRTLRYELARALAEGGDEERVREALSELDRALTEAGEDPSDARIHLEAGRLLEPIEPAAALQRYLAALEGDATEDAVARARSLLEASHQPATLIASLPPDTIDRVARAAEGQPPAQRQFGGLKGRATQGNWARRLGELSLLATALLRQTGADQKALDLLRHTYDSVRSPGREVVVQLAETLLDLDRGDDALQLAEREDPNGRDASLQLVCAEAHLVRGELKAALHLAEQAGAAETPPPAAAAVRALSLLGQRKLDEAIQALTDVDAPDAQFARALVHLQRLEYAEAREASWFLLRSRPNDPDALLVNAQTVVEALGDPRDAGSGEGGSAAAPTPGAEIDAARRLLQDIASELPALGPQSRWWRAQSATRKEDGRFAYFGCELRRALGEDLTVEEIDDVDRSRTTVLQDAALMELKATVLREDPPAAAAAYDEAASLFRYSVIDAARSAAMSRAAYDLEPTAERAAVYADCETRASYDAPDPAAVAEALTAARDAAEKWLADADDGQLATLTNALAWLRLRFAEVTEQQPAEKAKALLPWLFAGVAAEPTDAVLRAVLASQLSDLDLRAASAIYAPDAFDSEPSNPYVVETAIIADANYFGELERIQPLLAKHAELIEDATWRDAVSLALSVSVGDRSGVAERYSLPIVERSWAKRDRATATALLTGLPAARDELADAIAACLDEEPPAYLDGVFLAATLRRESEAKEYLAKAKADSATRPADLARAKLIVEFAFEDDVTAEQFFARAVEVCTSPNELYSIVHVTLPMLVDSRSGWTGPLRDVPVDREEFDGLLRKLEDVRACALEELDHYRPGLSALAQLADTRTGPAAVQHAVTDAPAVFPEDLPDVMIKRIGGAALERATAALPRRLLEGRLGRDAAPSEEDVSAALETRHSLAVALLARTGAAPPDGRQKGPDEVAEAADEIAGAATAEPSLLDDLGSYWRLDDVLREAQDDAGCPAVVRDAAAATRTRLGFWLDERLGLTPDPAEPEIAIVLPIAVEIGDGLVPIVDSTQDGGAFLYELIPAMRERILASTGVDVPGVRMRGAPGLPNAGYRIQVDEVPVESGSAPLNASLTISAVDPGRPLPEGDLTDVHPLTGARGLWVVAEATDDADNADTLTTAQYLVHRIELAMRAHLPRVLGPHEVATLVSTWSEQGGGDLVASVLPDEEARIRLTWLLQSLVADDVAITEWRTILEAVRDAGGITMPSRTLRQAVRARLRAALVARQDGRPTIRVPAEHEAALLGRPTDDGVPASPSMPRDDFLRWLRSEVAETGPAVTLVTRDEDARELVSALARTEDSLIATISEDELSAT